MVQSVLAGQCPTELAKSIQAGGKKDVAEESQLKEANKKNADTIDKPEASQQKAKVVKNQ